MTLINSAFNLFCIPILILVNTVCNSKEWANRKVQRCCCCFLTLFGERWRLHGTVRVRWPKSHFLAHIFHRSFCSHSCLTSRTGWVSHRPHIYLLYTLRLEKEKTFDERPLLRRTTHTLFHSLTRSPDMWIIFCTLFSFFPKASFSLCILSKLFAFQCKTGNLISTIWALYFALYMIILFFMW